MKDVLVKTKNVVKADKMLANIEHRIGGSITMISGKAGVGKTYYVMKRTFSNGWKYYCINACEYTKTFLGEVYKRLNMHINGSEDVIAGSSAKLQAACNRLFEHPKAKGLVFVFDEVNLLIQFRRHQILEVIRQFRDKAGANIIMVGEHDTRTKITDYNDHYFSRVQFLTFDDLSQADLIRVVQGRIEVEIDAEIASLIVTNSGVEHKSARITVKRIALAEEVAARSDKRSVIYQDLKEAIDESDES